jgi:peroxiredoxin
MKRLLTLLFLTIVGTVNAQTGYKVGDIATDFKLKNVDGKIISLADYNTSKGFLIVFTCNHCPYAKMYESRIMDLGAKYATKGYTLIAINPNDPKAYPEDSFENMQKRSKEKKYAFPYLLDETQEIAKTYGAKATPHLYILKKTNKGLVVEYIGAIDNDTENITPHKIKYAEEALEALLAGKKVATAQTKAIGCSIKWKDVQ